MGKFDDLTLLIMLACLLHHLNDFIFTLLDLKRNNNTLSII